MKRMKLLKINSLLMVLALTGCAHSAKSHTFTEAGKQYHVIECNGGKTDISVCYEKAKEICPRGYNVLDKNVKHNNHFPGNTTMGMADLILDGSGFYKGIKVQCK